MTQRIVVAILLLLLAALHVQLQTGRGSLPEVAELRQRLREQKAANAQAQLQIDQLASEVADLRDGLDTVEEKAHHDLSMVKPKMADKRVVRCLNCCCSANKSV